jgi:hypothetical protein
METARRRRRGSTWMTGTSQDKPGHDGTCGSNRPPSLNLAPMGLVSAIRVVKPPILCKTIATGRAHWRDTSKSSKFAMRDYVDRRETPGHDGADRFNHLRTSPDGRRTLIGRKLRGPLRGPSRQGTAKALSPNIPAIRVKQGPLGLEARERRRCGGRR